MSDETKVSGAEIPKPSNVEILPPETRAAEAEARAKAEAAARVKTDDKPAAAGRKPVEMKLAPKPSGPSSASAPINTAPTDEDSAKAWSAKSFLWAGSLVILILVGGLGGWATLTEIAGAIVSSGQIEVERNRQVVQHLDGGIVSEILVDEGDTVEANQVLIRLDGTLLSSQLTVVENQYFELVARRGRLDAERDGADEIVFEDELIEAATRHEEVAELMDGQQRLFVARLDSMSKELDQLDKRRSQIANQIEGIVAQQDALGTQLGLIQDELADQIDLMNKRLTQRSSVLALQREEARMSGQLGDLAASKAESEGRITELEIEALKLQTTRREEAITTLRDLQYRELELAEQRRSLREQLSRLDIRSPVAGVVYGLTVYAERSVIRPADPLMYVVPQDRPLIIATRVDPIHVDEIFPGQEVTLRFSALASRTTPTLFGTVTQVSADAFHDDKSGISYYRAEITVADEELDKLPGHVKLLPGMPVEAYLRTDDRTPLAYLLKPFTDYFNKAFRET